MWSESKWFQDCALTSMCCVGINPGLQDFPIQRMEPRGLSWNHLGSTPHQYCLAPAALSACAGACAGPDTALLQFRASWGLLASAPWRAVHLGAASSICSRIY